MSKEIPLGTPEAITKGYRRRPVSVFYFQPSAGISIWQRVLSHWLDQADEVDKQGRIEYFIIVALIGVEANSFAIPPFLW
jgi:hypothetical protein